MSRSSFCKHASDEYVSVHTICGKEHRHNNYWQKGRVRLNNSTKFAVILPTNTSSLCNETLQMISNDRTHFCWTLAWLQNSADDGRLLSALVSVPGLWHAHCMAPPITGNTRDKCSTPSKAAALCRALTFLLSLLLLLLPPSENHLGRGQWVSITVK